MIIDDQLNVNKLITIYGGFIDLWQWRFTVMIVTDEKIIRVRIAVPYSKMTSQLINYLLATPIGGVSPA